MPHPLQLIQSAMVQDVPILDANGKPKQKKAAARILGSAAAGAIELLIFHPVDTIAKRLMSNKRVIGTELTLSHVIFKEAEHKGVVAKWGSLFPGFGFAAGYKVLQRVYKFGGQPFVHGLIMDSPRISGTFYSLFGKDNGKTMMQATAGSLIGVGEVLLLPLDVLKIKAQTNPDALKGFNVAKVLSQEGLQLYRGALWTAGRNAPGSFALFGANAWVHHSVFHLDDPRKATFTQNFIASIAGGVASITVAAPLDTIKTRIQAKTFADRESGSSVLRDLIRNEGPTALFKGLTPKLLIVGPKLVFSFTIAQYLIGKFTTAFNQ